MESYYEPDNRWEMFGITSKEQFEQQIIVKGYFHNQVPEEVIDAFTTVEYLQAHAYYFWPMYDEAFNKALRILEMAVKLKAKLLNIPLENSTPKSKNRKKTLDCLTKEICDKPHFENLKLDLNRARSIRNSQMHPERNSYMGGTCGIGQNLKLFVIVLNELFRSDEWIAAQLEQQLSIKKQINFFENSLLILENNTPGILVNGLLGFRVLNDTLLIVCNPVLRNTKQSLEEHRYSNPPVVELSNFQFQKELLTGTSTDGYEIKIYKTTKDANLLQLTNHLTELNSASETDRAFYELHLNGEASWSLVKLEYNYLSKNLN